MKRSREEGYMGSQLKRPVVSSRGESDLSRNLLSGPIPPILGNLTYTEKLYLQDNNLTGPIPPELGNMTKLHYLELSDNHLTGLIPPEFGSLAELFDLNLANNHLEGPIPENLRSCINLNNLNVCGNRLNGTILRAFEKLESMTYLKDLEYSGSSGKIFSFFPSLSQGKGILQPHQLLAEFEALTTEGEVKNSKGGAFGEILRSTQEAIVCPPWVALVVRPGPGVWEYIRVNVNELLVEELSVPEYLKFKEELAEESSSRTQRFMRVMFLCLMVTI